MEPGEQHPIYRAALDGDVAALKTLVARGAAVDYHDSENDWTPLHYAAMRDQLAFVEELLVLGADPLRRDRYRHTPFDTAVSHGAVQVAGRLYELTLKADPDSRGTILYCAVTLGMTYLVKAELAAGADPNKGEEGGATPLHRVFTDTRAPEQMARLLLHRRRGLVVGASELPSRRLEIARLLLDAGADPMRRDVANWTCLRIAVHDGHVDLLELFLARGAPLDMNNHLMDAAAHGGHPAMLRFLASKGVPVTPTGHTPLHTAAWMAFPDCVETLLALGADRSALDHFGKTALDEARRRLASVEESLGFVRPAGSRYAAQYEDEHVRILRVIALLEGQG